MPLSNGAKFFILMAVAVGGAVGLGMALNGATPRSGPNAPGSSGFPRTDGWRNDEETEIKRDENGFIVGMKIDREVIAGVA